MEARVVVWMVAAFVAVAGCRSERQEKAGKPAADPEKQVDREKMNRDATRIQEKSRQRAQNQRDEALEKANKESEKQ